MTTEEILSRLERVRKSGTGWSALCPGHPDKAPPASIGEGDDGRVLLHCFVGCEVEQICEALNIQPSIYFSARSNGNALARRKLSRLFHSPAPSKM